MDADEATAIAQRLGEEAYLEIVRLEYAISFGRGEVYRARAQAAVQVATGIAAALGLAGVATGLFADPTAHHWWSRALVAISVLAWVVAAASSMHAAAYPAGHVDAVVAGRTVPPKAFIRGVEKRLVSEQAELRKRTARALALMLVALATTLAATTVVLFASRPEPARRTARVTLAEGSVEALASLCSVADPVRTATLLPSDLAIDRVEVELPAGSCQPDRAVTTSLRRDDIAAVVWTGD